MFEHRFVRPHRRRHRLPCVSGGVFKRDVVGLEALAVNLHRLREKRPAGLLRVQAVRDHHVLRRLPHAHQRDVRVVLRHDHSLVIHTRLNFDVHAPGLAIFSHAGKRMVIHRHLDRRKFRRALNPRLHIGRDADMHVLGTGYDPALRKAQNARCGKTAETQ